MTPSARLLHSVSRADELLGKPTTASGVTKKTPMPKIIATATVVQASGLLRLAGSDGLAVWRSAVFVARSAIWMSAENMSAFMPRPSASHSMVMPRTSGIFWMIPPYRCFGSGSEVTTIDLSGRAHGDRHERAAAHHDALQDSLAAVRDFGRAQALAARLFDSRRSAHGRALALLGVLQAPLETLDLARRIDQALLTGEERVALRNTRRRAGSPWSSGSAMSCRNHT